MNALLGKWLCKLGDNSQGLWLRVIMDKYRLATTRWAVPDVSYRASGMWKPILSVQVDFDKYIRYRANNGCQVSFWHDLWCANSSLKVLFPLLYLVDRRTHAVIANNVILSGDTCSRIFQFKRDLLHEEIHVLVILLSMLEKVLLSADSDDIRLWSPDPKGQFSVRSFYNVLIGGKAIIPSWKFYWNKLVLPRVAIFC